MVEPEIAKFFKGTSELRDFLETLQKSGVQKMEIDGLKLEIGKTQEDIKTLMKDMSKYQQDQIPDLGAMKESFGFSGEF